jgi:N-acetyl-1-D-myo-inositol-2-amino-2-deoxy-alpha-D-glucopyranoside deacetylase
MDKHCRKRGVLMAVHAHPDDESLGTGGTLARYAAQGMRTVVVFGTRGEEGEVLNPELDPSSLKGEIWELRMRELQEAVKVLGVEGVYFLGYRDSGMRGSASNRHPQALCNADVKEAAGRLMEIINMERPHVMITYNERGGYGHPDHVAIHRITMAAVDELKNSEGSRWCPRKLYHMAIPMSRLIRAKEIMEARGESFPYDIELMGTPDELITTWVDVSDYIDVKLKAISCHRSQIGPRSFVSRMTDPFRREALSTECYICVMGCRPSQKEEDLFEGMDLEEDPPLP